MGGDHAPRIVIEGAALARKKYPQAKFIVYGDETQIKPLVDKHPGLSDVLAVRHTPDRITSEDKPAQALRSGRNSSMRLAIDAVANGEASCVVSAGNTGALMAMAKFSLKVLPGISRPAIATYMPTKVPGHSYVMLDLGANVDCDPQNLLEFAVLGAVFSREVLKVKDPRIGLLNIGSEAMKGNDIIKQASDIIAAAGHLPGRYIGFVEGDSMMEGVADVVVTDGFTGNIALKTMEGTAKMIASLVKQAFRGSWLAKLGALLCLPGMLIALPALKTLKNRVDPRCYNGASFVGLRGLCIKSHGGTDAMGFANAVGVAADMSIKKFNDVVARELHDIGLDQKPASVEEVA